jgi:bifunctional DNase/RNase
MSGFQTNQVCEVCGAPALFYVQAARERRWIEFHAFCVPHGEDFRIQYFPPGPIEAALSSDARFDIEMLVIRKNEWEAMYYLKEETGARRFCSTMGYCEAVALYWALDPTSAPSSGTHKALADTISSLGGALSDVIIKPREGHEAGFRALLRMRQAGNLAEVPTRPSDAIIVAVLCGVPILVSKDAFARLTAK